jgi:Mn-containing catalase
LTRAGHAVARVGRCAGHDRSVFSHSKDLQFEARPDGPDAAFARRLQEALGGRWGELTLAHQYLFQGWTCRAPGHYRDLLLDVGTEELAHVEMISTMIAWLLQDAPLSVQEAAADTDPLLAAVYGGSLPAQAIVAGGGPLLADSCGTPWSGSYVTASGNLLADFHLNVTAEAQSRLQLARLFHMTDDPGVKQMLRFLLARDSAHQRLWAAAIRQLEADGVEEMPVPDGFPDAAAQRETAETYLTFSAGSRAGGLAPYPVRPTPRTPAPDLPTGDCRLYDS